MQDKNLVLMKTWDIKLQGGCSPPKFAPDKNGKCQLLKMPRSRYIIILIKS